MHRSLLLAALFAASLARAETVPPLLAAAEELLQQVKPENMTYKHQEPQVMWSTDPAKPAHCHTDCSGLLIALYEHCYPKAYGPEAFKRWLDSRRPTARRFYDAIAAEKGFKLIEKISEAKPGDILAAKYQSGEENTGHTMLVAEAPKKMTAKEPLVDGTEQWEVTVLDQTKSGHGPKDTRRMEDGKFRGGLGKGVFRVYVKPDGTTAGYTWSTFNNSKYYGGEDRVLAIGRPDPNFKP